MVTENDRLKILITGASRGIGGALSSHYVASGHDVLAVSSRECDLTSDQRVAECFSREEFADLDAIIHCAAANITKFMHKMTTEMFRHMVDTNLVGTFNLLQSVVPKLKRHGSIILFSSVAAFYPRVGQSAYACCKAGLQGLVKVLARELIVEDKYVFVIAPGLVETGMSNDMMSEAYRAKALEMIPMRRSCRIEEIAETIDYLIRAPYMTGQTIHLNGGYYIP
jgi:3-oxoacyl-[acyl-carrier protein] reductase